MPFHIVIFDGVNAYARGLDGSAALIFGVVD